MGSEGSESSTLLKLCSFVRRRRSYSSNWRIASFAVFGSAGFEAQGTVLEIDLADPKSSTLRSRHPMKVAHSTRVRNHNWRFDQLLDLAVFEEAGARVDYFSWGKLGMSSTLLVSPRGQGKHAL